MRKLELKSRRGSGSLHMLFPLPEPLGPRPHRAPPSPPQVLRQLLSEALPDHQLKIATQTFTIHLPLDLPPTGWSGRTGTVLFSSHFPAPRTARRGAVLTKHLCEAPAQGHTGGASKLPPHHALSQGLSLTPPSPCSGWRGGRPLPRPEGRGRRPSAGAGRRLSLSWAGGLAPGKSM